MNFVICFLRVHSSQHVTRSLQHTHPDGPLCPPPQAGAVHFCAWRPSSAGAHNDDVCVLCFLPGCGGCGAEIKNGQSLVALDKHWHLGCFKCETCGKQLDAEYISK